MSVECFGPRAAGSYAPRVESYSLPSNSISSSDTRTSSLSTNTSSLPIPGPSDKPAKPKKWRIGLKLKTRKRRTEMAKSLRSKWRRKCKAIKRERYGVKELARLKKTLGIDENAPADSDMKEISEVATVVDAKIIKEAAKEKEDAAEKLEEMDEDGKRVFSSKTMRDQHGNYPIWMNRRKILKNKKGRARAKKVTANKTKRLSRKEKKKLQAKAT